MIKKIIIYTFVTLILVIFIAAFGFFFTILKQGNAEKRLNQLLQKNNPNAKIECPNVNLSLKGIKLKKLVYKENGKVIIQMEDALLSPDISSFFFQKEKIVNFSANLYGGQASIKIKFNSFKDLKQIFKVDYTINGISADKIEVLQEALKGLKASGQINSFGNFEVHKQKEIRNGKTDINIINFSIEPLALVKRIELDVIKVNAVLKNADKMTLEKAFFIGKYVKGNFDGKIDLNQDKIEKSFLNILFKTNIKQPFFEDKKLDMLFNLLNFYSSKGKQIDFKITGYADQPKIEKL